LFGFDLIFHSIHGLLEVGGTSWKAGITGFPAPLCRASSELFSSFKASSGTWMEPWTTRDRTGWGSARQRYSGMTTV